MKTGDCWAGSLSKCTNFESLELVVNDRVSTYRQWVTGNFEGKGAPSKLKDSKTSIGEPINRFVECLKKCNVIDDVPVFIRIDQLEDLHQQTHGPNQELRLAFRHTLNRAIGNRDQRVAYRIGTRKYGWNQTEHLTIAGSGGKLEERRHYLLIDLDGLFRRKENQKKWIFEQFAEDALSRRLRYFLKLKEAPSDSIKRVFGESPSPQERADYFGKTKSTPIRIEQVLGLDDAEEYKQWSTEWIAYLSQIYTNNPLESLLAAAWGRQTGGGRNRTPHRVHPPPVNSPWKAAWWEKERLMQGVLQLAARRQQRMLWWGKKDILSLSNGNITTFIHVCHEVWDVFLKEERLKPSASRIDPLNNGPISRLYQAAAIQNASAVWYRKLSEQPGGDVRKRFIEIMGKLLRRQLRDDKSMSYPGANGFSVVKADLEADYEPNQALWKFLRDAVGYGDLFCADHVTKNKAGEARIKFYLNPILSPVFQIPAIHTKEPLYWKLEILFEICVEANLPFAELVKRPTTRRPEDDLPNQPTQLGFEGIE